MLMSNILAHDRVIGRSFGLLATDVLLGSLGQNAVGLGPFKGRLAERAVSARLAIITLADLHKRNRAARLVVTIFSRLAQGKAGL